MNPSPDLPADQRKLHAKLLNKLQYCKDVLESIITHHRSKEAGDDGAADVVGRRARSDDEDR